MSRDVSRLDEASAGSDEASEGWQGADETVRDLARAMIPGTNGQCTSHTVDDLRLQPQYQAAPDVGRASDLAQPGGFRRVHVLESGAGAGAAAEYARQPLVTTLLKQVTLTLTLTLTLALTLTLTLTLILTLPYP